MIAVWPPSNIPLIPTLAGGFCWTLLAGWPPFGYDASPGTGLPGLAVSLVTAGYAGTGGLALVEDVPECL